MLLLAFDTATPAVTVAVHDGDRVLAQETTVDARRHGELLAGHIEKVLAKAGASPADLTAIVAGIGPGPYTGLRAGLVTARVLGGALGIAVHGVCTLDVIAADAAAAAAGREFLVATDARRREVYWARYSPAGSGCPAPGWPPRRRCRRACPAAGEGPVAAPRPARRADRAALPVGGHAGRAGGRAAGGGGRAAPAGAALPAPARCPGARPAQERADRHRPGLAGDLRGDPA